MEKQINWSEFDKYPEDTVECTCGKVYRSHVKGVATNGSFMMATRVACPGCGRQVGHVRAARSDPEMWTL